MCICAMSMIKSLAPIKRQAFFVFCAILLAHSAQSLHALAEESQPTISVKISAGHSRFRVGQDIPMRVEICNRGEKDVFIAKEIDAIAGNAIATISFTLSHNKGVDGPATAVAVDTFGSKRSSYPPLSGELEKYWIALPPNHFYGTEVVIKPSYFKRLSIPGTYQIRGKYSSRGFLAKDVNNPLLHYAEELKQLPYGAWVGEVETNSVQIEITNKH